MVGKLLSLLLAATVFFTAVAFLFAASVVAFVTKGDGECWFGLFLAAVTFLFAATIFAVGRGE